MEGCASVAFGINEMKIASWLAGVIFIIENALFEIIWFLESNCDSSFAVTDSS